MKTKEELYEHIDSKMDDFEKKYFYWFKGGEYYKNHKESDRFDEWRDFIKNTSKNILHITSSKIIKDVSRSYDFFNLEFKITDNQFANFWIDYCKPIFQQIHSGISIKLEYKPSEDFSFNWKDKSFPENFLQKFILPKIKKAPLTHDYSEISQVAKNGHLIYWSKSFDLDYSGKHDRFTSKEIQDMLKNDTKKLSYYFLDQFNKMYSQFKPIADSLERNYENLPMIIEEKRKEDLRHKIKTKSLSMKLFE